MLQVQADALGPHKAITQYTHTSWTAKGGIPDPVRAIAQTPDGYPWLGTHAGLYRFVWFSPASGVAVIDPKSFSINVARPPVVIESIKADNQMYKTNSELRLQQNTKNLNIQFVALSLAIPERVRFRYMLEGYDDQWHGPTNARTATYTNPPPRTYRFQVVACKNEGAWNEQGAILEFNILPAFYQTTWFFLVCIAIAELDALLPAVLDRTFKGELEIFS